MSISCRKIGFVSRESDLMVNQRNNRPVMVENGPPRGQLATEFPVPTLIVRMSTMKTFQTTSVFRVDEDRLTSPTREWRALSRIVHLRDCISPDLQDTAPSAD